MVMVIAKTPTMKKGLPPNIAPSFILHLFHQKHSIIAFFTYKIKMIIALINIKVVVILTAIHG